MLGVGSAANPAERLGLLGLLGQMRIPAGHRLFVAMLAAALAVRLATVAGYAPALYYNDSYEYVGVALRPQPYVIRPSGYSFFLMVLQPFHSFRFVVVVQHLMGLAVAVMAYALLRRYAVSTWVAAAATAPHLFDGYEVQLEHMVLAETLFTFLAVAAVVSLLWWRPAPTWACLAAGGLLAAASLTRVLGIPLAVVAAVWLLAHRPGWRKLLAFASALAIPLLAYAGWYWSFHGKPGITGSGGVFLYSRTTSFADCPRIRPPPEIAILCPAEPVEARQPPSNYIWHTDVPLHSIRGPVFSRYKDSLAGDFARRAALAQPLDYARVVVRDFARTFGPRLTDYPTSDLTRHYRFSDPPVQVTDKIIIPGGTIPDDVRAYERGDANPRAHQPLADWLLAYQRHIAVPGPVVGVMLFGSLAGIATHTAGRLTRRLRPRPRTRQPGDAGTPPEATGTADSLPAHAPLVLFTATACTLLLVPPLTAGFDHRYVTPVLVFLGAGAGFVFQGVLRRARSWPVPGAGAFEQARRGGA